MIEHGEIEYALIVDGEVSNQVTERTIERLSAPDVTADQFRAEFASLTLGSGAAAMVLGRAERLPRRPPLPGQRRPAPPPIAHFVRSRVTVADHVAPTIDVVERDRTGTRHARTP